MLKSQGHTSQQISPISSKPSKIVVHIGEADEVEFREGGKGWLVLLGCGVSSMIVFGMINSYGVFQTHYETTLFPLVPSSKLSIIGATQASITYFLSPFSIPLVHAFGIRQVLALGATFLVIAFFGLATTSSTQLWKCYLFEGVFFSIGGALQFGPAMTIPSEWFKKKRGTAFGISAGFVGVGGVVWPIIFNQMIQKHGFKWTVMTIAFLYVPLGISTVLLIPQKLEAEFVHKEDSFSNSKWDQKRIKHLPSAYKKILVEWRSVIRNARFSIILLINLLVSFGSYPVIFYIDFFGSTIGGNSKVVQYLTMIYVVMGAPGRAIPAIIADRVGRINVLIVCTFLLFVSIFALWIPSIHSQLLGLYVGFVVLFGFTVGPLFSLFPASLGQLFGIKGSEARLGLFFFTATPGPILGCLIAGSFIPVDSGNKEKILHSFYKVVVFSGVILAVCALLLLGVRVSISRKPCVFV